MRSAIEEFLRYDSPVQTTFRTVLRETEFDSPQARQSKNLIRPVITKMASLSPTATAYALLTMRRLNAESATYQWMNIAGAIGMIVNGLWNGALPSAFLPSSSCRFRNAISALKSSRAFRTSPAIPSKV